MLSQLGHVLCHFLVFPTNFFIYLRNITHLVGSFFFFFSLFCYVFFPEFVKVRQTSCSRLVKVLYITQLRCHRKQQTQAARFDSLYESTFCFQEFSQIFNSILSKGSFFRKIFGFFEKLASASRKISSFLHI